LRSDGLITVTGKDLTIDDVDGLKAFAEFNPNYLHLNRRRDNGEGVRTGTDEDAVTPEG
jgi:hypothetical protein